MNNLGDSSSHAKLSDSAYSNSCSNSQSRRSRSTKSTLSGSHSSGSSGYGGKPSTLNSSQPDTDGKKKKPPAKTIPAELVTENESKISESKSIEPVSEEKQNDIVSPAMDVEQSGVEKMEDDTMPKKMTVTEELVPKCSSSEIQSQLSTSSVPLAVLCELNNLDDLNFQDGFSCVISMLDGIVIYTTSSLSDCLGYPRDMWIGRSFIDFVHPKDQSTFASQISSGLSVPKNNVVTDEKALVPCNTPVSSMLCRIRRYKTLSTGFAVRERIVHFQPFRLNLFFRNISDNEEKFVYLVIQAAPIVSAFKTPNEVVSKATPFVIRHSASGALDYIDQQSVPYLGYLPQDLVDGDALQLYHPDDLVYLRSVYERIVKQGVVARSKQYRLMAHNGDYVKLETEWSSFINPWSKKLEFVIAKHHVIEGPSNPDVFQENTNEKTNKDAKDKKENNCLGLKESIIRIMDEVLTKPAEVAKQRMSKRCQDIASFMESLIAEQPKVNDELRVDIQDPDHSYFVRDSLMIGEISPHHEFNDSKSSTGTPLSYTQLNYNENMQRYFNSYNEFNQALEEIAGDIKETNKSNYFSPMAINSGDSAELTSSCESSGMMLVNSEDTSNFGDYLPIRLTKSLLIKHNIEMEKELLQNHRDTRVEAKIEREKTSNDARQKRKEHLARCNAIYQPTSAGTASVEHQFLQQNQRLKRVYKNIDKFTEPAKHYCSSRQRAKQAAATVTQNNNTVTSSIGVMPMFYAPSHVQNTSVKAQPSTSASQQAPSMQYMMCGQPMFGSPMVYSPISPYLQQNVQNSTGLQSLPNTNQNEPKQDRKQFEIDEQTFWQQGVSINDKNKTVTTSSTPSQGTGNQWQNTNINNMNGFVSGIGIPQQMSIMSPIVLMQGNIGMFPMCYTPEVSQAIPSSVPSTPHQANSQQQQQQQQQQLAMQYMMCGQAVIGSPFMYSPVSPQMAFPLQQSLINQAVQFTPRAVEVFKNNLDETFKPSTKTNKSQLWRDKKRMDKESSFTSQRDNNNYQCSPSHALKRSAEEVSDTIANSRGKSKRPSQISEETIDRTDGESSYSSFYSSFFKTESGSAEESSDAKKNDNNKDIQETVISKMFAAKKVAKRKLEPPWLEKVCVTSELVYKYQVMTKSMDEVLLADKEKISNFQQPLMVNDQLNQLYLDLQLEGVAARLTLEEGITSSGSSGEESFSIPIVNKGIRKKREYSKLVMIYEEDAPLPPPLEDVDTPPVTNPPAMTK